MRHQGHEHDQQGYCLPETIKETERRFRERVMGELSPALVLDLLTLRDRWVNVSGEEH